MDSNTITEPKEGTHLKTDIPDQWNEPYSVTPNKNIFLRL